MRIIGCDFHPSFQQIAICDLETGEVQERKLSHGDGQADGSTGSWASRRGLGSRPLEIASGSLIW